MEKAIVRHKVPDTDSVEELARFWDSHDLTDYEEDLEEVAEPVFVHTKGTSLSIELRPAEAQHLRRIARSEGVKEASVIRRWIVERLRQAPQIGRYPKKALSQAARKRRRG